MKVLLIANVSANGKVLLAENPNHQPPQEGIAFYVQKVIEKGNVIMGRKTFEVIQQFPGGVKQVLPGVEIVLLSLENEINEEYKVVGTPQQALKYLEEKGFNEIVIGGGTQTFNSFLQKGLVTDLYLNYVPVITGNGGILGTEEDLFTKFNLAEQRLLSDDIIQLHLSNEKTRQH